MIMGERVSKFETGVEFLMDLGFFSLKCYWQSAILFLEVIVRASKQRMAGNVPMATLEKQRSFVCRQAGTTQWELQGSPQGVPK